MPQVTVKKTTPAARGRAALYVVFLGADPVGLLEKFPNTRSETHPWKAYGETGRAATYLGAFYEQKDQFIVDDTDMVYGGRPAALQAVLDYHTQLAR